MKDYVPAAVAKSREEMFFLLENRPSRRQMLEIARQEIDALTTLLNDHPGRKDIQELMNMWREFDDLRMLPPDPLH